jgi:hypothetical protein
MNPDVTTFKVGEPGKACALNGNAEAIRPQTKIEAVFDIFIVPPATLILAVIYTSVVTCGELCEFGEKAKNDDANHCTARLAMRALPAIKRIHFLPGLPFLHMPLGDS